MKRARGKISRSNGGGEQAPTRVAPKANDRLAGGNAFFPWQVTLRANTGEATMKRSDAELSLLSGLGLELLHNLPVGVALVRTSDPDDVKTWRIVAANSTARKIIGESLIDFLLTRVAKSFPSKHKMEEIYERILRRRASGDLHWVTCEVGGIRRTYSVTGFAVPPKYLGLLMQDATAHTEVRRSLVEHKHRYEEISQAIETFLWRGDPETLQTKWVSSEAERVLGYWPEHWANIPNFWLAHIDPLDREMVQGLVRGTSGSGSGSGSGLGARFDYRMKAADGRTIWLHAVIHLSEDTLGEEELTGVMVDITARKNAEEQALELSARVLQAQDEERRHIARELHDSLGQYLSVVGMNIGTLARTVNGLSEEQARLLTETTELAEVCSRELRTVSYLMHPPMLDEVGLAPALEWYAGGFSERSHIEVAIDVQRDSARLPKLVETAFFRIAQEALTNIYRHAQSETAAIRLQEIHGGILLEVLDHGTGLDAQALDGIATGNGKPKGVGIRGMRERMRELGGTLRVTSGSNGTTISAHVPWTASVFDGKHKETRDAAREARVSNAG
jgi:PAS domain S-box-containing protein